MMFHVEPITKHIESFHVKQPNKPLTCMVCMSNQLTFFKTCKDHFLTKQDFSLWQCQSCCALTTWPQPAPEKIFNYYASEDYVSHNDTKKGFINRLYHLVKSRSLQNKIKLVVPLLNDHALLDYGCGTGDFLLACVNKNISVKGAEPDPGALSIALKKGLDVLHPEDLSQSKNTFGVITLWHVLEHTYNPTDTVQKLKSYLVDGGSMVIAVPNYQSNDAIYYKDKWAAYDVPRHLFHFSEKSIKELAIKTEMTLVAIKPMIFDSFYVSMLSEKYSGGNMFSGVLRGLISNLSALKTSQYSSMIYILRK